MESVLPPLLLLAALQGIIPLLYSAPSGKIHFVHLITEKGLSQNTVQSIFQDKSGFIGTPSNPVIYDSLFGGQYRRAVD